MSEYTAFGVPDSGSKVLKLCNVREFATVLNQMKQCGQGGGERERKRDVPACMRRHQASALAPMGKVAVTHRRAVVEVLLGQQVGPPRAAESGLGFRCWSLGFRV